MSQDENAECPLCMETLELDDLSFYPCTCEYQICRFCWHRIRTDENGLCPACRKPFSENPANFKPLSVDEMQQKVKKERRAKKQRLIENRKHLQNVRVLQKNLVFVVGLPTRLACPDQLKKHECFGKFGQIHKVVVNQSTSYAGSQGPSAGAYVTYVRSEDALRAIENVNSLRIDGRTLKASLGTTKYCNHFLKGSHCPKSDCMYLHELGDEEASFTKEQMQANKHTEYEKKLHDQLQAKDAARENKLTNSGSRVSPPPSTTERIEPPPSSPSNHRAMRHKSSECSSDDRSSCDDPKSPTPLSERSDSPGIDLGCPRDDTPPEENDDYDVDEGSFGVDQRQHEHQQQHLQSSKEILISNVQHGKYSPCQSTDSGRMSLPNPVAPSSSTTADESSLNQLQADDSQTQNPQTTYFSSPKQQSLANDIELDFDPICISREGLQDLIKLEQHNTPLDCGQSSGLGAIGCFSFGRGLSSNAPGASPPGIALALRQGVAAAANGGFLQGISPLSPPHSSSPGNVRRAPPPGFGPPLPSTVSANHWGSSTAAGAGGGIGSFPMAGGTGLPPYFNQIGGNDIGSSSPFGFRNFSTSSGNNPPGIQQRSVVGGSTHDDLLSMKEQQDQLRQLLPSVNISFGPPTSSSSNAPPPGLQGILGHRQSPMGIGLNHSGHTGHGSNSWNDALHDPAVLSSSRHFQNGTTTGPEKRPPFF